MRSLLLSLTIILALLNSAVYAQNGFIRGTVLDEAIGESLPGVQILVVGTTTGTLTDLDGKFNISIAPGTYNLKLSYISYETLTIEGIVVEADKVNVIDNIYMREEAVELGEVTITAQAVRNTENALSTIKRKSANVIDGISASSFRKIGDSDAASSMQRVTGVSVEGGKYVYVRGLGDRYTKTILNGVDIPGLDPDRNSLQMDLFPTNIIDNILVHKSFSADLPADFTGGVIDINTKDFPDQKIGKVGGSIGINPQMHFNSEYLTYKGGSTDFLGFDDGTRAIPATENVPFFSQVVGNPTGEDGQRYREILEGFNPTMGPSMQTSLMDFSIDFSIGNQKPKEKVTLGYDFAISYKFNTEFYKDAEFGRYGLAADPNVYEMERREYQFGDYGTQSVLLSGLAGFAIKTLNSKYGIKLMHLQNGESKAGEFYYEGSDQGSVFNADQYNLDYGQRSITNLLLSGEHKFDDARWSMVWKASPTLAMISDPDIRFTRYEDRDGTPAIGTEVGFPERIWRDLNEINLAGIIHVTRDFDIQARKSSIKFGGAYTYKERDYEILSYALNIRGVPLTGDPNELFFDENLWPLNGEDITKGTTYEARFIPNNPNSFNSNVNYAAAYVSADLWMLNWLKAIVGLRVENYVQRYTGQDQLATNVLDNDIVLDKLDFFPSVNLVFTLNNNMNIRASYSKTTARPTFKELSFAEIYDPITSRTFIGGLFFDGFVSGNDTIVYWDGNLTTTDIHNFDIRWELYQQNGQMFSLSGFYKQFLRPIEIVQYATQTGAFQPRNVGDGEVFGAEAEIRIALGNIISALNNFRFILNVTVTESRIKLSPTEYQSRVENARTGQTIDEYRDMAGQSPYIINAGLSYEGGDSGFWNGLQAGLYYNVKGETLLYVGIVDRPDVYTRPFHSLNFNATKRFGEDQRMSLGLRVENILNADDETVFKSYEATDQFFEKLSPGFHFKVSFSYSLY